MNPFEIRLELLKLATSEADAAFCQERQVEYTNHEVACDNARKKGDFVPEFRPKTKSLSTDELLTMVRKMNEFVTNG